MYINIKLPPAFGSFNRLRRENYPFNGIFTSYLAAVSRLGLAMGMDVDRLVGYIEDRVFEGQRLPDVPDGDGAVSLRYKTDDPDVTAYIGGSTLTNRAAVMYIARMTLRLSAAYGTSLLRLTKVIEDLGAPAVRAQAPKQEPARKEQPVKKEGRGQEPVGMEAAPSPKPAQGAVAGPGRAQGPEEKPAAPAFRISNRAQPQAPVQPVQETQQSRSAEAARAALSELEDALVGAGEGQDIVETNPFLQNFL